ncbi:hypothetical protein TVAG_327540 [Trichomonas vaginalis G3]|uniref:receptor protein-tyrosine kinase n=1 Tax=Trichomonas vaginalis (strain ATCC PRA-98 / G3) TaxID=412133 RepID=A2FRM6_TRIV3|nr:glycine-rich protein family [Trichomonas vaginalis G3]EAX92445.1 hypothetical protein TVAG_327540 [Trichomonas vaginalis G3]KAI5482952.1 glycine-rich protein family [Trichomonas vaginalis G3]|eukprot:XP_001305375.1 hypothetical protein [Trichomonas vaginalis G3]
MIRYSLYEDKKAGIRTKNPLPVSKQDNKYVFEYPCEDSSYCTDYSIELPPSLYKFELYGASGGSLTSEVSTHHYESGECIHDNIVQQFNGNTKCKTSLDYGGAGGYVSGLINIKRFTRAYVTIGGSGKYLNNTICSPIENCYLKENMVPGGYGGGGRSSGDTFGTAIGGGQTSVQFLENTLYHRVIVSGAGGGADDYQQSDARGGSGGGLVAQGWWTKFVYNGQYLANSSFGFTFGSGEAARLGPSKNPKGVQNPSGYADKCGGGGGWFGGFSSLHNIGGCGGGSSWVLTKSAYIPPDPIESRDEFYEIIETRKYNFDQNSGYLFYDVIHIPGIWQGNGRLVITVIEASSINSCFCRYNLYYYLLGFLIFVG